MQRYVWYMAPDTPGDDHQRMVGGSLCDRISLTLLLVVQSNELV